LTATSYQGETGKSDIVKKAEESKATVAPPPQPIKPRRKFDAALKRDAVGLVAQQREIRSAGGAALGYQSPAGFENARN
jgi:hypothetical protein